MAHLWTWSASECLALDPASGFSHSVVDSPLLGDQPHEDQYPTPLYTKVQPLMVPTRTHTIYQECSQVLQGRLQVTSGASRRKTDGRMWFGLRPSNF